MSATTTTRITQLTDIDTKAQALATAVALFKTGLRSDVTASSATGKLQSTGQNLYLGTLDRELCAYLSGLGLTAVVGDAAIANAAGSQPDVSGTFLSRWTAKINAFVP